eukprot:scaffold37375_cov29-Tisochrysis_lutea.AAC.1
MFTVKRDSSTPRKRVKAASTCWQKRSSGFPRKDSALDHVWYVWLEPAPQCISQGLIGSHQPQVASVRLWIVCSTESYALRRHDERIALGLAQQVADQPQRARSIRFGRTSA